MRLYKLGEISYKKFKNDFDLYYDKFKSKAISEGFHGEIKIIKENNRVIFYKIIDENHHSL